MHTLQIKRRDIVAVTQKVPDRQSQGDHGAGDCTIRAPVNPAGVIISVGLNKMVAANNYRAMDGDGPIIVVEDLRKRYGDVQAVDGVSFQVKKGEVFALLGPNGSGKTTTVEIIEGMRTADSGHATVAGIDVGKDPRAVKHLIGVQLQSSAFFEHLQLHELLRMLGSIYRAKIDPEPLLRTVDLWDRRSSSFRTLSGGQKQRFSIAAALVNDPAVIFLDEPTTGLDPQARRLMWETISGWQAEGRTIVLTTHYMEEAEELCDRVAVMDSGKIITLNSPDALIEELIGRGFHRDHEVRAATLEDVFLDLTGRSLREF